MHDLAPRAELCVVSEATHAGLLGQREVIEDEIEAFLVEHDLVGS
jgi:hypothetical protein